MTKEQKDKILKSLAEDRNNYARECERRIAAENYNITGADYVLQRFLDVLSESLEITTVTNAKEAKLYPINEDVKKGFEVWIEDGSKVIYITESEEE